MITLGGHVSAAGGVARALDRAEALKFEAMQIHPTAPQSWAGPKVTEEEAASFKAGFPERGIKAVFFHNIYLTNFASSLDPNWHGTIGITQKYLKLAAAMGASGVVTHVGSHKGDGMDAVLDRVIEGLRRVLAESPSDAVFLIENTAGAGGTIGRTLEEIERMIVPLWKEFPNIGICIDTCHAFASGIPIHTAEGLDAFVTEFAQRFGIEALRCIHLNDSKTPFGSNRDRHENVGLGEFGAKGFSNLFQHPALQNVPFIMEVPGLDGKSGPDAGNRDAVRALEAA